jgi:hypothetical protein
VRIFHILIIPLDILLIEKDNNKINLLSLWYSKLKINYETVFEIAKITLIGGGDRRYLRFIQGKYTRTKL